MLRPTPEQLALLTPVERFWLRLALVFNGPRKWVSRFIVSTWGIGLLWFTGGRRFRIHGLENLERFDKNSSLVMAANHRSFFDFYTITYTTIRFTRMTRKCSFPVRSTFFYERPLGAFINFILTGMAMFPPILRERGKAEFNRWSLERMADDLRRPGTLIGIHPEGRRNKDEDPFTFLKAQPGIGHLALEVDDLTILPVFVKGMTNDAVREWWRNWTAPKDWPIDIRFGEPIRYDDLVDRRRATRAAKAIADRTMGAVADLAEEQRAWERASQRSAWPAQPVPVLAPRAVLQRLRAQMR